jgi:hypothetical protein
MTVENDQLAIILLLVWATILIYPGTGKSLRPFFDFRYGEMSRYLRLDESLGFFVITVHDILVASGIVLTYICLNTSVPELTAGFVLIVSSQMLWLYWKYFFWINRMHGVSVIYEAGSIITIIIGISFLGVNVNSSSGDISNAWTGFSLLIASILIKLIYLFVSFSAHRHFSADSTECAVELQTMVKKSVGPCGGRRWARKS